MRQVKYFSEDDYRRLEDKINEFAKKNHIVQISYSEYKTAWVWYSALVLYDERED